MKILFYKNRRAMTLIEIMCVLVIISIVTSITLPSINNFRSSERCKAEASILVSYIRQAKYQAMQDNCFKRIEFANQAEDDPNEFSVETYEGIQKTSLYAAMSDFTNWASISDEDKVTIDSSVEVDLKDFTCFNKTIYFKPDGYIYEHDDSHDDTETIISEQRIVFRYGSSAVAVDINALGVISSEAMTEEENDYFSDDYDPEGDTDEDKYNYNAADEK